MEEVLSMLEHACRLCDKSGIKMHNIFDKTETGQQIIGLVKECLPLIIYRKDPLSKHICANCYSNVLNFTKFRNDALETLQKHKYQLQKLKSPNDAVTLYLTSVDGANNVEEDTYVGEECDGAEETLHNGYMDSDASFEDNSNCVSDMDLLNSTNSVIGEKQTFSKKRPLSILTPEVINDTVSSEFECRSPPAKKPRLVGPRSEKLKYDKMVNDGMSYLSEILNQEDIDRARAEELERRNLEIDPVFEYEPLSLMSIALNAINCSMYPDFVPEKTCNKNDVTKYPCQDCGIIIESANALAQHQVDHLYIMIGPKVDDPVINPGKIFKIRGIEENNDPEENLEIGNAKCEDTEEDDDDNTDYRGDDDDTTTEAGTEADETNGESLLVPVNSEETEIEHEIVLEKDVPTVNGRPLVDYPKEERKKFYKTIIHNGIKRKFCNLCRYTFKDNWAIELHYLSSACYYTCRYCGARFTKYKNMFEEHVSLHKGQEPSSKIFGQIKKHSKHNPYVKRRYHSQPKIKPIKMKTLMQKKQLEEQQFSDKPTIKIEPISNYPEEDRERINTMINQSQTNQSGSSDASKKPYQAYFCRKCYKVFYKLDEFDVHVLSCSSTVNDEMQYRSKPGPKPGFKRSLSNKQNGSPVQKESPAPTPPPREARLSTSGRPIRNCVREITRYVDEPVLEPEWFEEEEPKPKVRIADMIKTENVNMNHTSIKQQQPQPPVQQMNKSQINSPPGFACGICSSSFPTLYSRNSHMRIHKSGSSMSPSPILPQSHQITNNRMENVAKKVVQVLTAGPSASSSPTPSKPKTLNNPGLSNIMKLVQNNPHLTIKSIDSSKKALPPQYQQSTNSTINNASNPVRNPQSTYNKISVQQPVFPRGKPGPKPKPKIPPPVIVKQEIPSPSTTPTPPMQQNSVPERKAYRCQGCHKPFANKSSLYFHKRNHCVGNKFSCPLCKQRFGTQEAYNTHVYYSHPE